MWDVVTQSLEEFIQANWNACVVAFENESVDPDNFEYYARFTVAYGDNKGICLGSPKERRQIGVLYMQFFGRPAVGMAKLSQMSTEFYNLFVGQTIKPTIEGTAPSVVIRDPKLVTDPNAKDNWVTAVVSFDFYFDTE